MRWFDSQQNPSVQNLDALGVSRVARPSRANQRPESGRNTLIKIGFVIQSYAVEKKLKSNYFRFASINIKAIRAGFPERFAQA